MSGQRQPVHSVHNKPFWTEFFHLYESLPALWNTTSAEYKNRQLKSAAYDTMAVKLREVEPNANREDVLRKINIFRTNFRRECARINSCIQEGKNYKSTLWYFDLLSFLYTDPCKNDKKRKYEEDGEKTILRKRRPLTFMSNVENSNSGLIEYSPISQDYIDYDSEETVHHNGSMIDTGLLGQDNNTNYLNSVKGECGKDGSANDNDYDNEIADTNQIIVETITVHSDSESQDFQQEFQKLTFPAKQSPAQQIHLELRKSPSEAHFQQQQHIRLELHASTPPNQYMPEKQLYTIASDLTSSKNTKWSLMGQGDTNNTTIYPELCDDRNIYFNATQNTIKKGEAKQQPQPFMAGDNGECRTRSILQPMKMIRNTKPLTNTLSNNCNSTNNSSHSTTSTLKLSNCAEILAKSWAIQYDELPDDQKVFARKAIADILFAGCMSNLALGTDGRIVISMGNHQQWLKNNVTVVRLQEMENSEMFEPFRSKDDI